MKPSSTDGKGDVSRSERYFEERLEDGSRCLEAALRYAKLGWSVLACCPHDHLGIERAVPGHTAKCKGNQGKRPWHTWKHLQDEPASDEVVRGWWNTMPYSNVGLALGPASGLIRVDVDGEAGQGMLRDLARGDLPPTLEFRSGRSDGTGLGLLYKIPPGVRLRTTTMEDVQQQRAELRFMAKGAQTVLPPSRHKSGSLYEWVPGHSPDDLEAALAPSWAIEQLMENGRRTSGSSSNGNGRRPAWLAGLDGVEEGHRHKSALSRAGVLLANPRVHEDDYIRLIWSDVRMWNEHCDPPEDEDELLSNFCDIVEKERAKRQRARTTLLEEKLAEMSGAAASDSIATTPDDPHMGDGLTGHDGAGPWQLWVQKSDPPLYYLKSPIWSASERLRHTDGCIVVTMKELISWAQIRKAVMDQSGIYARPDSPRKPVWDARKGPQLLRVLLAYQKTRKATFEYDRVLRAGDFILVVCRKAPILDDASRSRLANRDLARLEDGSIVFKVGPVSAIAHRDSPGITFEDIRDAANRYGKRYCPRQDGKLLGHFYRLDPQQITALDRLLSDPEPVDDS